MRDFTDYDYESLVDWITDKYKNKPGFSDNYESSTSQTLIQLLADVTDALHYKLERRSQESYTAIAKLATSIRAAVSANGYRPRRKVSATGTLFLELQDENGDPVAAEGNISLPYGTKVTFGTDEFIVAEDALIETGQTETTLTVIQGRLMSETFNFNAEPYATDNYIEFADYINKEEHSLNVVADNDAFDDVFDETDGLRVRAISFADATMPVYDIKFARNGMRVVFGDDIFGKKPQGDVAVSWIESDGADVNVIKTGLEFSFENNFLTDDIAQTPQNEYRYSLVNSTPIRGGKNEETIEEIRENVTAFLRTNDRAVTNFDYEFWVRRSGIGDIVDVKAYGEHETNRLIFTMNNVYFTYVTGDDLTLNTEQEKSLREYIDQLKVNTTHIVFRPANRIYLQIAVDFRRHPDLPISESQLYRVLRQSIESYLEIDRGSIGKQFQHSEFVEYLQNLDITFNNIKYRMTDFVRVKVTGMYPFSVPKDVYDVTLEVTQDYVITANDVWNITIDGDTYTVVTTSTDTVTTMVEKMRDKIFQGTGLMLAIPESNKLRIRHPEDEGFFTISIGSGDLSAFTVIREYIQIPRPNNVYNPQLNQLVPGSLEIVNVNGEPLFEDNGAGALVDVDAVLADLDIDYSECRFEVPSLPSGDYYIKFQQNEYQNFEITRESVIDLMPIRTQDDPEEQYFFSEINVLV